MQYFPADAACFWCLVQPPFVSSAPTHRNVLARRRMPWSPPYQWSSAPGASSTREELRGLSSPRPLHRALRCAPGAWGGCGAFRAEVAAGPCFSPILRIGCCVFSAPVACRRRACRRDADAGHCSVSKEEESRFSGSSFPPQAAGRGASSACVFPALFARASDQSGSPRFEPARGVMRAPCAQLDLRWFQIIRTGL